MLKTGLNRTSQSEEEYDTDSDVSDAEEIFEICPRFIQCRVPIFKVHGKEKKLTIIVEKGSSLPFKKMYLVRGETYTIILEQTLQFSVNSQRVNTYPVADSAHSAEAIPSSSYTSSSQKESLNMSSNESLNESLKESMGSSATIQSSQLEICRNPGKSLSSPGLPVFRNTYSVQEAGKERTGDKIPSSEEIKPGAVNQENEMTDDGYTHDDPLNICEIVKSKSDYSQPGFVIKLDQLERKVYHLETLLHQYTGGAFTSLDYPLMEVEEDLHKLNQELKNQEFRMAMLISLKREVGRNDCETVRRIFRKIGTTKLWSKVSFKGQRMGKINFSRFKHIIELVGQATVELHPMSPRKDIEEAMKSFLKCQGKVAKNELKRKRGSDSEGDSDEVRTEKSILNQEINPEIKMENYF